ncbi:MAG: hypothetical protein ACRBN8_05185 [Nannocystales bacterium]
MVWRMAFGVGVVVAAVSGSAVAAEPVTTAAPQSASSVAHRSSARRSDPWGASQDSVYVRLEADGIGTPGVWPNPSLGGEVAILAGRPNLHARVGVGAMATPTFTLGERGKIGTVLETSDIEGCAASHHRVHRVRLCAGMQAGVMHLRWGGFANPGRRDLPWVAVVGGGSYAIALGRVVDLHAGIGLGTPVVRPRLVTRSRGAIDVERSGFVFSTFRIGLGFRLG